MNIVGKWSTVCQTEMLALATDFLAADLLLQEIILRTDFLMKFGIVIDLIAMLEGMLEPSDIFVTDVLVACVLCRMEKGVLPLRVINVR